MSLSDDPPVPVLWSGDPPVLPLSSGDPPMPALWSDDPPLLPLLSGNPPVPALWSDDPPLLAAKGKGEEGLCPMQKMRERGGGLGNITGFENPRVK